MRNIISSLRCCHGKYTSYFELTNTHLIDKWAKGRQSGERRIALSKLSADLSYTTSNSNNFAAFITGSGICLAIANIFFFSVIQEKIPLLSIFFCILSGWFFIRSICVLRLRTWTIIHHADGKQFAWFIHGHCKEEERKVFEKALTKLLTEKAYKENSYTHPSCLQTESLNKTGR